MNILDCTIFELQQINSGVREVIIYPRNGDNYLLCVSDIEDMLSGLLTTDCAHDEHIVDVLKSHGFVCDLEKRRLETKRGFILF